jgi:hypothetical protein
MMDLIWRARADSEVPLASPPPALVAEIADWRRAASRQGLADIQRHWKLGS